MEKKGRSNVKALITIDVEGTLAADDVEAQNPFESVDILDKHLQSINGPVTLFVTPAVIEHRTEVVQRWESGNSTVGLHIHPAQLSSGSSDWLTDYTREEIEDLISEGCDTFATQIGTSPTCFRAGRWEYSDRLLDVLRIHGFHYDASLKPECPTTPYSQEGICEVPLTVYSNTFLEGLLWYKEQSSIPLHADAFLKNPILESGFRLLIRRLLNSSIPYLMISYHDYDLLDESVASRISRVGDYLQSNGSVEKIGGEWPSSTC